MASLILEIDIQGYKIHRLRQTMWSLIFFFLSLNFAFAAEWHTLTPGILYQDFHMNGITPWSHLHVFRIDLKSYQLDLVTAGDLSKSLASAAEFAQHTKALIAINGGFFDEAYRSLGLRIRHYQQRTPLKPISWWGVFYIDENKAYLSSMSHFSPKKTIQFALQSGPRLLIDGKIPKLKAGRAERSALGITENGEVILVVTDTAPITTTTLAHFMKSELHCVNALNLDGGSSSQLYAEIHSFHLQVHGFSNVSDAIIVKPTVLN